MHGGGGNLVVLLLTEHHMRGLARIGSSSIAAMARTEYLLLPRLPKVLLVLPSALAASGAMERGQGAPCGKCTAILTSTKGNHPTYP